jgi:RNA polymerase sigma factor (sigma-70 family)
MPSRPPRRGRRPRVRVNPLEPAALNTGIESLEPEDAPPDDADEAAMGSMTATFGTDVFGDARETPATLDAFLAQVERRAFRMAELQLRQREDAMDAVQDAMLRLVRHYRDKPAAEWSPLFWGILRRRIVDLQRRRKVRSIVIGWLGGGRDDDGDELPAWEPADRGPGPLERLHDAQSYADMAAAVRQLPQRQREAFMLRMLEGLDVAETARAMGCSEGSVKTHLSRAMHHLRDQLEDWR